jgi:anti-sigma B factor antagonist
MNLSITIHSTEWQTYVSVSGEIDVYTAPELKEKLFPFSEKEEMNLIVDLTGVTYMDSTGLGVMVGVFKSLRKHNGRLQLTGLSDRLNKLFRITGLADIMNIKSGVEGEKE